MYPTILVELATAFYDGQDVTPALHDALVEGGYINIATWCFNHPKGKNCLPGEEWTEFKGCRTIQILLGSLNETLISWEEDCGKRLQELMELQKRL